MSDSSQGPGWWQASDGKWYPPEQAPGYQTPGVGGPYGAPYGGGGGASSLDIGAAFNWAVAKYQQFLQPLLILGLVVGGIPFVIQLITRFTSSVTLSSALSIGSWFISVILSMLAVQASLEIATTGGLNPSTMWQFRANIGNYVLAAFLFGLMLFAGCFALCVGLIIVWLIFGLWQFLIVDRNAGVVDSLSGSKDLTLGPGFGNTFLGMLIFLLLVSLSQLSGALCPFIALIGVVLVPFAYLFGAYVYKSYSGQPIAA